MAKALAGGRGRFLAAGLSNVFMSLNLLKCVLKTAYDCVLDCVIPSGGDKIHLYLVQIGITHECEQVCVKLSSVVAAWFFVTHCTVAPVSQVLRM